MSAAPAAPSTPTPTRTPRPRPRMPIPRLHPTPRLDPSPPPHPLEERRHHRLDQPDLALRPPPPRRPPTSLDHHLRRPHPHHPQTRRHPNHVKGARARLARRTPVVRVRLGSGTTTRRLRSAAEQVLPRLVRVDGIAVLVEGSYRLRQVLGEAEHQLVAVFDLDRG